LNNNWVVNDMHGSSTKKNKEYQEKLPIVVLRAEGIIYSKANFKVTFLLCFLLASVLNYFILWFAKQKGKIKMT